MKTLAMIKFTLYEYLHGIGFVILLFIFGMIFVVFGVGLSVEETITGDKLKLFGQVVDFPIEFTEGTGGAVARIIQLAFAISAATIWGPIFFMFMASRSVESMLTQGNRHLLLSKPMHRWHVFMARLGGFMLFSAIVVYLFLGGLWLIVGIKTGSFIYQPFVAIPVVLLIYLSLLSIIAFISVLVENFFVAGGATVMFYFITFVIRNVGDRFDEGSMLQFGWKMLHGALPKISELSELVHAIYADRAMDWQMPVWSTVLFCAVVLAAATFLFWRKEY